MDYKTQFLKYWLPVQGWIVALLVLVSAVWCAQITWFFLDPATAVTAPRVQPATGAQSQNGTDWAQLSNSIAQREFFGEVVVQQNEPAEEVPVEAPETTLSLTLLAVMAEGEGQGYAIISQRSGAGKVFAIGDDLFGQATLANVYGDRIIIDRRGQKETLRYVKIDSGTILQSVDVNDSSDATDSASSFQEALTQANEAVASGGDMASQVQGMVDYVTQRANEDPEGFVREMGLEPTEGGYQVTRQARQLQMVGLRPGDVVTAVNDMPVGNVQSDQSLLNQIMQTGGEIKIQIRRGSRSFTIYQTIPTY